MGTYFGTSRYHPTQHAPFDRLDVQHHHFIRFHRFTARRQTRLGRHHLGTPCWIAVRSRCRRRVEDRSTGEGDDGPTAGRSAHARSSSFRSCAWPATGSAAIPAPATVAPRLASSRFLTKPTHHNLVTLSLPAS